MTIRFLAMFWMICAAAGMAQALDASLLEKSDARYIPATFRYALTIETTDSRGRTETTVMKGEKKGSERNLLVVEEPVVLGGIVHLRKGPSVWTYYPTLKKNIKTSFQSLVLGSILSYGDLLAFSLAEDYAVSAEAADGDLQKLTLVPKPGKEGYAYVYLWLDKTTLLPRKREYYSQSGILMKTCTVVKIDATPAGVLREIVQEFYEPLRKNRATVRVSGIQVDPSIPDRDFNPESLKFISGE